MSEFNPAKFAASLGETPDDFDPARFAQNLDRPSSKALTVQEMHPDFTTKDRLIVKNFSNNNEAAVNYLQKQHPDLEIAVDDKTQQIKARKRDGSDGGHYRVLDPDTGFFSSDILRDIGDVGFDVASGLGTTAATAAAGLAGGAGSFGVGAIPAAMAGGAAAGAGAEGLRQRIGNALGIEQDMNWGDVGIAGAAGAVSPLLFGTGAAGGQIAKTALKEGVEEGALAATQRGLLKRGLDSGAGQWATGKLGTGLSKIGGAISGTEGDNLKTFATRNAEYLKLEDPKGVRTAMKRLGKDVNKAAAAKGEELAGGIDNAIAESEAEGLTINAMPLVDKLRRKIAKYENEGRNSSKEVASELRKKLDDYFYVTKDVTREVTEMADSGLLDEFGNPVLKPMTRQVTESIRVPRQTLTPSQANALEQDLSHVAGVQKMGATMGTRFTGSETPVQRKVMLTADELRRDLAKTMEKQLPKVKQAKKAYGEFAGLQKDVKKFAKNPRQAFTNLRNADIASNRTNLDLIQEMDDVLKTDVMSQAKLAQAYEALSPGRKSFFSDVKNRTSIPAGLLGGGLGAYAGYSGGGGEAGYGSGIIGGLAGGGLGAFLGGPTAMRRYISLSLRAKKAAENNPKLRNAAALKLLTEPEIRSAWKLMGEDE